MVRQIMANKAGMAGVFLLACLVVLGVAGPWMLPFANADSHWHDITYWQDSPAAAPPIWTRSLGDGLPSALTQVLASTHASVAALENGASLITWDFAGTDPTSRLASDIILKIRGEGTLPVSVVAIPRASPGALDASAAPGEEIHRQLMELSPDQDTRLSLLPGVKTWSAGVAGFRVSTWQLAGQNRPRPPTILLVGQVSGLLGTDAAKRDIFTGVILGIRWALVLGVLASFLTVVTGMVFGIIAGCFRGIPDFVISRLYEFFYLIPVLPFLIVISTVFKPSIWSFLLLVILFFWTRVFKPIYAMALQIREETFIEASRALGAPRLHVLARHVFPTLLPYGFAVMALSVPSIIVYEASVSLLGLGDSSTVTWGQMLHDALTQGAVINQLWWWVLPPGLAIALTGLSFALMGKGLDQALHPRFRQR